jgi:hypothetical protein
MAVARSFVAADANTLQIDIDRTSDLKHFHQVIPWFLSACTVARIRVIEIRARRSTRPHHWHITIRTRERLRVCERLALQTILGSDRARELHNWQRIRARAPYPMLLIDPTPRRRT